MAGREGEGGEGEREEDPPGEGAEGKGESAKKVAFKVTQSRQKTLTERTVALSSRRIYMQLSWLLL